MTRIRLLIRVLMIGIFIGQTLWANDTAAPDSPGKPAVEEAAKQGSKKNFDKAAAEFEKALQLDKNYRIAQLGRQIATDAHAQKIDKKAAQSFFKAIREYEKGKADKAVKECGKGLTKAREYAPGFYLRAFFYETASKSDEAIADYSSIIAIAPANADAYLRRATLYEQQVENSKAIADYSKVIEIDPKNGHAYAKRGAIYEQLSDTKKAFADYDAALELQPDADLYYHIGEIYLRDQKYNAAIKFFTKHVNMDTGSVYGYLNRGVAYYEKGKYSKAVDDSYEMF